MAATASQTWSLASSKTKSMMESHFPSSASSLQKTRQRSIATFVSTPSECCCHSTATNNTTGLKIIAQAAHDRDPVPLIAAEKKILDFKDRKIAFLDRVYTLKRTYIFSHGKTSKNITPTTFDEIMAEYDYFKTSTAEFETEEDRHFYLATVDRWLSQIVRIGQVWQDLEKDHAQIKKIAQESTLATLQPQVHEEVVDRPWKQFLDGDASGWPMDWAQGKDVVEKMRVPNGGVRIIEDWEKETKSVYRDLDEARGGPSRFRSGLGSALQTKVLLNDGKHVRTLNIVCYCANSSLYLDHSDMIANVT